MPCHSPLRGWKDVHTGGITFRREHGYEKMEVPCGQCLGCRLDYSRMWAMRITHEATMHESDGGNCFITLTYRNVEDCSLDQLKNGQHVPSDWSLHKSHMTKFIKRLRKFFGDQKIRYFYAGEYGKKCQHGIDVEEVGCPLCNVGRPHYHMCLFNGLFTDLLPYESDGGITRYTSPSLERIWGYGFVDVGELNFASASYCAKYIVKKIKGVKADDWYYQMDIDGNWNWITPEYVCMSRGNASYKGQKVGIGAAWLEKYEMDVYPHDHVPLPGMDPMNGVPRYYDEIVKEKYPEMFEQVQAARLKYLKENKEDYTLKRLEDKHKVAKAKMKLFDSRDL